MRAIPFQPTRIRRPFMLMPLVDVIFLLLTFFMLSSQISPYGVLPVSAGAGDGDGEAADATPVQHGATAGLLIAVSAGTAQVNGEAMSFQVLAGRAENLREGADGIAVVLPRRTASVQDVVSVLEVLRQARFTSVSIRTRETP